MKILPLGKLKALPEMPQLNLRGHFRFRCRFIELVARMLKSRSEVNNSSTKQFNARQDMK